MTKVRWFHIVRYIGKTLRPGADGREYYLGEGRTAQGPIECKRFESRNGAKAICAADHEVGQGLEARGFVVEACDCGPRRRPKRTAW